MMVAAREARRFVSLGGVAEMLGVSKPTVRRLIKCGRLKADRLNGRLLISEESYSAFVDEFSSGEKAIPDAPITFLIKHSAYKEHWRGFHALLISGKLRCVALKVSRHNGHAEALIETTLTIANELRQNDFDVIPSLRGLYAAKDGEEYAVVNEGGPACVVREIDSKLAMSLHRVL